MTLPPPQPRVAAAAPATTRRDTGALVALCLVALMFGLEISSVPVILPALEQRLHADFQDAQWIMNAYTLACTSVLMAAGTLADRYGRRRVLVASLWLFGVASLACGWASSAPMLIAARFAQGVGAGAMMICQFAILSQQFREPAARSRAFALWGVVAGIGLGFGPLVGAAIVALADWRWVFLVHAPLALLTLGLVRASVQESRDPDAHRLDAIGMLALTLAVFALVYFITLGTVQGFAHPLGLAWLAGAVLSFVLFIVAERRSAHPLFDFSVFRIHRFNGALMGSIGMNFSFWPFMIYLPIYFQAALAYDVMRAGWALLAYTLPALLVPPLAERLALRHGVERVIPAGLGLMAAAFLLMAWGNARGSGTAVIVACLAAGVGLGLTNSPVTNTTTGSVTAARAGMASGIDFSARLITLAVNIALMGFVLVSGIARHLGESGLRIEPARLALLAQDVAAGRLNILAGAAGLGQAALRQGFGDTMRYAGIGVGLLALASHAFFRRSRRAPAAVALPPPACAE
ncbi:MFS transporter [Variovorax arabinosiphilus]|uniref:MFS transporter n=1 Tax=Variovorax arabinosiphilus TaxID=3053498 RepID=UPI0025758AAB|nr:MULTISPECIES: MFS transporter [unclassified Variovorax]MDM0122946.1 MFS transporter [Variovorax sp. J2L1-78]MDM0132058.1 MFS transporter [Variovorax sp. J2L1-63]MDM0235709.1 MFS transporter [Variovorax sp. J2R1-6]